MHLNFTVLFPASDVWGHIRKVYLFLEEGVHLGLDWVWLAGNDKSTGIIDARHLVEIFVLARVRSHNIKLRVENILAVSSVGNTIVNNQLNHDLLCVITVEGKVFSVAGDDVTILSEPLLHSGLAVAGVVLNESFWADIAGVILTCFGDLIAPSEWLYLHLLSEEFDGLVDSVYTLFGS